MCRPQRDQLSNSVRDNYGELKEKGSCKEENRRMARCLIFILQFPAQEYFTEPKYLTVNLVKVLSVNAEYFDEAILVHDDKSESSSSDSDYQSN